LFNAEADNQTGDILKFADPEKGTDGKWLQHYSYDFTRVQLK